MSLSEPTIGDASEEEAKRLVGQVLSERYRIDQVLGLGGMGAVYRAEHLLMHKRVAIKVLHPEMTRMPEVVARFEREAMAAAHIEHPNVASATDFGKLDDGSFFLVLEFVEGKALRDELDNGALPVERAVHITHQVLSALGRAHALGIVHRDLKPENVMLVTRDGDADFVKVLDFGIAKVPIGELQKQAGTGGKGEKKATAALTQLGMVYGTPEYMAPEQALGQDVDHRADLYALGVMLFEMLTGKRPFDADSPVQILGMVVSMPVPSFQSVVPSLVIPSSLEEFNRKLLAKLPNDRFPDARAAADALDEIMATYGISAYGPRSGRMPTRSFASNPNISSPNIGMLPTSHAMTAVAQPSPAKVWAAKAQAVLEDQIQRFKALPRHVQAMIAAGFGVALLLFLVVIVAFRGPSTTQTGEKQGERVASQRESEKKNEPKVSPGLSDDDVKNATTQGVSALEALRDKYPNDARVLRALVKAEVEAKRGPQAATALASLVDADKTAIDDKQLREEIVSAAQLEGGEAVFPVLEKQGASGADVLYELTRVEKLKKRAWDALSTPEVAASASPALKLVLDLRATSKLAGNEQCKARRDLFVVAKDVGDARVLSTLRQWQSTRGCGFLRRGDCYPCLHTDGSLGEAISAITAREKSEKSGD